MKRTHSRGHTSVVRRLLFISLYTLICITILFITLLFLPRPSYKTGFTTLDSVTAYAKKINENTPYVGDNTIKPDFSPYYKSVEPNWRKSLKEKLVWLGSFIKISKTPAWSPSYFKTQIEELAKKRHEKNFKGNCVCKITPTPATKIVLFGNIQGAFHSLTRDLAKLKELNIIDNNLKITNPDFFIVFIGDLVGRSAFSMPTLSLVMHLLNINPDNAVCLRGHQESDNYWQEHSLKAELQALAAYLDSKTVPLADQVNAFFDTLPRAFYAPMTSEKTPPLLRISGLNRAKSTFINEASFANFLYDQTKGLTILALPEKTETAKDDQPNIAVIFEGEKKRETFQPTEGVRMLSPDMGAVAWTTLSCPTLIYQKALKVFHDAFVIITPADKTDKWTLTLYSHDVRTKDPFKATAFNLLSGVEEATGKMAPQEAPEAKDAKAKPDKKKEEAPKKEAPKVETPPAKPEPTPPARPEEVQGTVSKDKVSVQPTQSPTTTISPFDQTTTSTVAAHVREIGKNARELAEHAEAIAAVISKIQITDNKKDIKKEKRETPKQDDKNASAFEPIQ